MHRVSQCQNHQTSEEPPKAGGTPPRSRITGSCQKWAGHLQGRKPRIIFHAPGFPMPESSDLGGAAKGGRNTSEVTNYGEPPKAGGTPPGSQNPDHISCTGLPNARINRPRRSRQKRAEHLQGRKTRIIFQAPGFPMPESSDLGGAARSGRDTSEVTNYGELPEAGRTPPRSRITGSCQKRAEHLRGHESRGAARSGRDTSEVANHGEPPEAGGTPPRSIRAV
jgi:hypothetical protein